MANMVTKVGEYGVRKTILIGQESYYAALPVKLSGTANAVVKAGEPIIGDLKARGTAFTIGTTNAVGINLHEVKLDADGKGNATCVFRGCVDVKKIDSTVATHIGTAAIPGIDLVEGSAI
jgi:predicted acyltransferase (DUF342 family)